MKTTTIARNWYECNDSNPLQAIHRSDLMAADASRNQFSIWTQDSMKATMLRFMLVLLDSFSKKSLQAEVRDKVLVNTWKQKVIELLSWSIRILPQILPRKRRAITAHVSGLHKRVPFRYVTSFTSGHRVLFTVTLQTFRSHYEIFLSQERPSWNLRWNLRSWNHHYRNILLKLRNMDDFM
jgi:hypothetical protein